MKFLMTNLAIELYDRGLSIENCVIAFATSLPELEKTINSWIVEGYTPYGFHSFANGKFSQQMLKIGKPDVDAIVDLDEIEQVLIEANRYNA